MPLLYRIERYLRASKMPPTVFGRETVRDPRFVFDLRLGRIPRAHTSDRVNAWLDARLADGSRK
jgi:hypothetical protein